MSIDEDVTIELVGSWETLLLLGDFPAAENEVRMWVQGQDDARILLDPLWADMMPSVVPEQARWLFLSAYCKERDESFMVTHRAMYDRPFRAFESIVAFHSGLRYVHMIRNAFVILATLTETWSLWEAEGIEQNLQTMYKSVQSYSTDQFHRDLVKGFSSSVKPEETMSRMQRFADDLWRELKKVPVWNSTQAKAMSILRHLCRFEFERATWVVEQLSDLYEKPGHVFEAYASEYTGKPWKRTP
jgi:hypothetical protein